MKFTSFKTPRVNENILKIKEKRAKKKKKKHERKKSFAKKKKKKEKKRMKQYYLAHSTALQNVHLERIKCAMNDNTVLFSSLLLDACIVPVSVPVCHLDSRQQQQQQQLQQQQQQQPSLMNNQQHQLQHQQNNPPHLAYQQANHHSYTTVTTSNQHGPTPIGAHQQGPVPPHLQQQVSPLLYPESFHFCLPACFLPSRCQTFTNLFDCVSFRWFLLLTVTAFISS